MIPLHVPGGTVAALIPAEEIPLGTRVTYDELGMIVGAGEGDRWVGRTPTEEEGRSLPALPDGLIHVVFSAPAPPDALTTEDERP